jgi:hypothetical protein
MRRLSSGEACRRLASNSRHSLRSAITGLFEIKPPGFEMR